MVDLLPALMPLASRARQDITWRKVGASITCEKKTPLNKTVLKRHLRGIEARGVCPILEGESTTRIAVLDLDSHKGETPWHGMVEVCTKVVKAFEDQGHRCVPFRSTGGKGIHLYFLWDTPQDCYSLRKFFAQVLAGLNFKDGTKGIARGEIEIFPKQDLVPKGGCGSQFILPLSGLSVPLDPFLNFKPRELEFALELQWPFSSNVPLIEKPKTVTPEKRRHYDNLSPELKRMLDAIPNEEPNYDRWITIGMALKTETGGNEEGLALWEEWSARCPDYSGFEQLQYKWDSFRDDKATIVTLGSIKKLASQYGWEEDYSNDFEEVVDEEPVPEKRDRFDLIRVDDFVNRLPPKWLIKGILPAASTSMTFGGSGDGKTFAILDMACCIARGISWRGHKVRQGKVVYICAEGIGGFTTRLRAYGKQRGVSLKDLGDWLTVIPAAPNFTKKEDVAELIVKINAYNDRTALIIIDTMAQTTTGADENSAKDMNIALKYLEQLRAATNCAAHLIHHAGKDEDRGARGSSTLKAALDVQFQVSREGDNRLFWVVKMKDGIDGYGWNFKLETVELETDDEGDSVSSCCVEYGEETVQRKPEKKRERSRHENLILDKWTDLGGGTLKVSDVIDEIVAEMPFVGGTRDRRRDDLAKALDKLVASGDVTVKDEHFVEDSLI